MKKYVCINMYSYLVYSMICGCCFESFEAGIRFHAILLSNLIMSCSSGMGSLWEYGVRENVAIRGATHLGDLLIRLYIIY